MLNFLRKMKRKRKELGIRRTLLPPSIGFPEILVGKVPSFFFGEIRMPKRINPPCFGRQISGQFPSGNLDISVFLAGHVSSLEIAHTLLPLCLQDCAGYMQV